MKECVICHGPIGVDPSGWDGGHNADPVAVGQCCLPCNRDVVTPERLRRLGMPINLIARMNLEEESK